MSGGGELGEGEGKGGNEEGERGAIKAFHGASNHPCLLRLKARRGILYLN